MSRFVITGSGAHNNKSHRAVKRWRGKKNCLPFFCPHCCAGVQKTEKK
ncbi:hypothetical protein NT01EI_1658 [Edwardsiella ictaluri 93-146]|uniref:Uncharacterized protein n=1 Tax=Edwardsiella ictaluri (strain 93-146) TaxID=634503 RepID=C5BD87_EDWI9|nr:hypothetical protein NT01EI_1658 [Edwardsiella ictaluri 93-146]